jgi:hypothetical protein
MSAVIENELMPGGLALMNCVSGLGRRQRIMAKASEHTFRSDKANMHGSYRLLKRPERDPSALHHTAMLEDDFSKQNTIGAGCEQCNDARFITTLHDLTSIEDISGTVIRGHQTKWRH